MFPRQPVRQRARGCIPDTRDVCPTSTGWSVLGIYKCTGVNMSTQKRITAHMAHYGRTLYRLSPRRGERPPKDPCASDRNLNDDFWRALQHTSHTCISAQPSHQPFQRYAPYPTTQPETMVTEPENCERRAVDLRHCALARRGARAELGSRERLRNSAKISAANTCSSATAAVFPRLCPLAQLHLCYCLVSSWALGFLCYVPACSGAEE